MSGWRDAEGRTAADRRKLGREGDRTRFLETAKNRPLTLVRSLLGAALILILIFALLRAFL
jgi:hypothetical protein